jgi:hypothetical protein
MPIIGDVFGLTSIYERQVENIDNNNFESWPESATYGYFGGGYAPPIMVCTIDRLDFSNETTSLPGNGLSQARQNLVAVSSSSYGYFGGGYVPAPPNVCTIDRIDFSNETLSLPGNNLPQGRNVLAVVSSSSYGYFGGGRVGLIISNTIDRLDFSSETFSAPGNDLTQARSELTALSNNSYGYFGGGLDPSADPPNVAVIQCTIDRIDFSNETLSLPGNGLPQARSQLAAVSNS